MSLKWICCFASAALVLGCKEEAPLPRSSAAAEAQPSTPASSSAAPVEQAGSTAAQQHQSPTAAQPRLQTLKLWVGPQEITAEIAYTPIQIETGMMWRTNMAEMEGMLFAFGRPFQASFWMKNTLLPLSCAYISPEGTILEIHDMKPRDESPIRASTDQVQYVLEMNKDWFKRHNVEVGALVTTERGTLQQIFKRR